MALLLVFFTIANAQVFNESGYIHLAPTAVMAEDENGEWTIEEVASGKYDSLFVPVTDPIANINFTTSTYWMKTSFIHQGPRESFYLECARPITNEVNYYELDKQGEVLVHQTSGDEMVFCERPIRHRNIIFELEAETYEQKNIVVSMRSDGEVINAALKLWRIEALSAFTQKENLFLGIYYGLLIFVLVIFGFFTVALKQRIYTFYVSYVATLLLMQASLDGTAFQMLWPGLPWLANHAVLIFSSASVLLMMLYAATFLKVMEMPKTYRYIYYGLGTIVSLCLLTSLMSGLPYELTFPIVNATSMLVLISIISGIFIKIRRGDSVNRFFSVAFICVLSGGLLFIFGNLGLYFNEFLTTNAIKIGSAAEIVFLSLAMAGRYQDIQREKEEAQKEAYDHLEALNVVTQNQNIRLEKLVVKRTAEIQEKSEQLEEKNKEIIDSINYAKRIQAAILPSDKLFYESLPNAFVLYMPKDIVAGDFYWLKNINDLVIFAAADCTGHGVPGAMVSVVCNNALNRATDEFNLQTPGAILDKTAELVDLAFEQSEDDVKDGMDISLCVLNKKTNELKWAGANNPLWIVSKNDFSAISDREVETEIGQPNLFEIKADKQPIGRYAERKPFTEYSIQLEQGDCFYTFSDGYADQFGGPKGKKYKTKKFKEFILKIHTEDLSKQRMLLHNEFEVWRGDIEQIDDVCVIGVRV